MKLAILVKTCQAYIYRRDVCEQTWAKSIRDAGVPVFFVEGLHCEDRIDNGLIQLTCADDRCALTKKVAGSLRMLQKRFDFDYVWVVDDDMFVHPKRFLDHEPAGDLECRVFHPRTKAHKKVLNGKGWAHGGGGYWMSRRLIAEFVARVKGITRGDDVVVTRVAYDTKLAIVDRPDLYAGDRYSGDADARVAADNTYITCHHIGLEEMRSLWRETHVN